MRRQESGIKNKKTKMRGGFYLVALALLTCIVAAAVLSACDGWTVEEPEYYQVIELHGSPYERGYSHGQQMAGKIRSIYTMLLTNTIFPNLNRERDDVSSVMIRYQNNEIYGDGKFAALMMLESALQLEPFIPDEYIEEMHGVADGSGMTYEQILTLNTFFDTLMAFRSLTFYIKLIQGPVLQWFEFDGLLTDDGIDNDGDGEIDEDLEGRITPYEPRSYGSMREVPTDRKIRFIIDDLQDGVDPDSIRIQVGDKLYTAPDPAIEVLPFDRNGLTSAVEFIPPEGWPEASDVTVLIQGTDLNKTVRVLPNHPRSMRDERIAFSTVGYGKPIQEIHNRGVEDGRTQPPSLGFAVRGSATKTGEMLVGHNFAILDADITHKHAMLQVHHTDKGQHLAFVTYPGLIWGFSGINGEGLSYFFNTSDTLNNGFVDSFNEGLVFAKLSPEGLPVGLMGREALEYAATADDGAKRIKQYISTFGWNIFLADAHKDFIAIELDGDFNDRPGGGFTTYQADSEDSDNLDVFGQPYASVGPDDLRMSSHYQKNLEEIEYGLVTFHLQPQRYWTTFYFRSVKAFWVMSEIIEQNYGNFDLKLMAASLRYREMEDQRDSMFSTIMEPEKIRIHVAAGQVPATSGAFKMFDLKASIEKLEKANDAAGVSQ